MTFSNIWPLGFLILIPIIILLYILKQKVKDQPFSSALLWREIYKNLEARTPFEKLKHNILMYLQILAILLLILALMAPVMRNGGFVLRNTIIVIDTSASMETAYKGSGSRLKEAVSRAENYIDGINDSGMLTVVSCDDTAEIIYQGQDRSAAKKRIEKLTVKEVSGNLDKASGIVGTLVSSLDNVDVVCYTDSEFDYKSFKRNNDKISLCVESIYSSEENLSVDYTAYAIKSSGADKTDDEKAADNDTDKPADTDSSKKQYIEAICKITNHGTQPATTDVSLYLGNEITDVQTVSVDAGDSETVYFSPVLLKDEWLQKGDSSGGQNDKQGGSLNNLVLKAELSEKDSLNSDNHSSVAVSKENDMKILLLSEGNVFLEKALALYEGATVYKSEDVNVLKDAEDFNLYVFDGIDIPKDYDQSLLSDDAAFLFINYDKALFGLDYIKGSSTVTNCMLQFEKSDITEYVENYSFGVSSGYTYDLYEWANPVITTEEGAVAGYYGSVSSDNSQRRVGVLGFDIHNTDLALQTEFPIFMSQLTGYLLTGSEELVTIRNFPIDESEVVPIDNVNVDGVLDKTKTGGRAIRNILLAIAVIVLIIEWIIYHIQVHSTKKKQFLAVRGILLLLIVLAIMGVSVTKRQRKIETIFLIDVSDSMSGNLTEVEKYLKNNLSLMPKNGLAGVVAFGRDSAVEQFVSGRKDFLGFSADTITTSTNIERGVTAACSLFHDGVTKRLVLITDGCENEGSMSLTASIIKNSDVELLVIPVDDSVSANDEVYIDGLNTPSVIHVGDHYNITVSIRSNVETDALLFLYSGRTAKGQKSIHLTKGSNQFIFEDVGAEGTIASYKAVIEPDRDTISVNNTFVTFSQIEAQPKVLVVEGKKNNAKEFEKILTAANIGYDTFAPDAVPVSLSQLNTYKAVITIDVYYDDLRNGFAKTLESYVKDYAGGYICIGGDNSYALGGYRNTELEELLPVYMDPEGEKEIPKMAMVMVIDQSGSMSSPSVDDSSVTGLDLAKQAAVSGVKELRETDEAGVLAFDDKYNWTVPITTVDDSDDIVNKILTIGNGGGTSIYPALEEAYARILKNDAKIKHIILLTDGQDEFRDYDVLLSQINNAGITVSSVAVGNDSDQKILKEIADKCGGRFYYTDINNSIPRIFAKEVYLSTNEYLINEEFYPEITSNNEILSGVMDQGCPALLGYIASRAKERADVILSSSRGDPVLSTWQCGLGRTVAWNSDATNEWTAYYGGWDNYPMLWSNIIHYVISDTDLGGDNLDIIGNGGTTSIVYETEEYDKNTVVTAAVSDENGEAKEITLDPVKPGSYMAEVPSDDVGIYNLSIRKKNGEEIVKNYNTAFANQYSMEYRFSDNSGELLRFIKQVDGTSLTFDDNIWNTQAKKVAGKVPLTMFFIITSMLLLLFDIIIRRFSIDVFGNAKARISRTINKISHSARDIRSKESRTAEAEIIGKETSGTVTKEDKKWDSSTKEAETIEVGSGKNGAKEYRVRESSTAETGTIEAGTEETGTTEAYHDDNSTGIKDKKAKKRRDKAEIKEADPKRKDKNKDNDNNKSDMLDMNALLQKKKDRT